MVRIWENGERIWPVNSGVVPYRGVGSRISRFSGGSIGRNIAKGSNVAGQAYFLARGLVRSVLGKRADRYAEAVFSDPLKGGWWKNVKAAADDSSAHPNRFMKRSKTFFDNIGNWEKRQLNRIGFGSNSSNSLKSITWDPKGPRGPGPVLPPPPPRSLSNMKRSYNTTGHGGGKFRGKKVRKLSTAAFRGCQLSREYTDTFGDDSALYVGHNSHPIEDVLRSIGLSLVRMVAKKWNQDFDNFESFINGDTASADSSIKVTITYRDSVGGILQSHNFAVSNSSWYQLGDQIMHQIIQLIELESPSPTYWHGHQIIFANSSGTTGNAHNLMVFDFSQLKFKISGFSMMKLQNRTVSTLADVTSSEQMHDVANNPLTGKIYQGTGQIHEYKFNNDYGTITDLFKYGNNGYFEIGALNSSLTDPMQKVLKRPPSYKAFKGMTSHTAIRVNPGEIKSSVCKASYTHNLNMWIKKLFNVIRASSHLGDVTPAMCSVGRSNVIGLSHMLFDAADPAISVALQIDTTVSAICTYKKKAIAAPVFDRNIATVALIA